MIKLLSENMLDRRLYLLRLAGIKNDYIINFGKNINNFNGFDPGIFFGSLSIFEAWEHICKSYKNTTLSAAILVLAEKRQVSPNQ